LRGDDFLQAVVKAASNTPLGIVRAELGQIGDVADVIPLPRFLDVPPIEFLTGHLLNAGDGFEHRDAVLAPATKVINLPRARVGGEFLDGGNNVMAVNVVSHLLALMAKDGIGSARQHDFNKIGKKTVELDARVGRPS
jgi:hypothetical protein